MLSSSFQIPTHPMDHTTCYPLVSNYPHIQWLKQHVILLFPNYLHTSNGSNNMLSSCFQTTCTSNGSNNMLSSCFQTTHTSNGSNNMLSSCFQLPTHPMAQTTCYPLVSNYPHIQWLKLHVILLFPTTRTSNGSNNMLSSCFQTTCTSNGSNNMLTSCFQTTHTFNGYNNMLSSCFQLPTHPMALTTCYPLVSNYPHIQ